MLNLLGSRVLIQPTKAESKTSGGIIIPDTVNTKFLKGKVITVGPGTKDEVMTLKAGDQVLYVGGQEIEFEGEKYILADQSNVIATY